MIVASWVNVIVALVLLYLTTIIRSVHSLLSVCSGNNHICALAVKHNSDVGGRARCWGDEEEEGKTDPPKDVSAKDK